MADAPLISVVSPVYKAEKIVPELVKRIKEAVGRLTTDFEIVLVEDGSPDGSWKAIEQEASNDTRIKAIKLNRNYGQHTAIAAGIEHTNGAYIIVMDCDLQDDPAYIGDLYRLAQQGYDIVYTRKKNRAHSGWRNFVANIYNGAFRILAGDSTLQGYGDVGGYSMISRKAAEAYKTNSRNYHHYLSILRSTGLLHTYLDVEHRERFEGTSSYTFSKLLTHALNGVTLPSETGRRAAIATGITLSLFSCIILIILIILYLAFRFSPSSSGFLVIMLFACGMIITRIAIRTRAKTEKHESKKTATYTIERSINDL